MNHFFAIPLPPAIRDYVAAVSAQWRKTMPPGVQARWYPPEDCHITVKFLGNVDTARLPDLIRAAQPVAAAASPFDVPLASPGGFPNLREPFVLWSGVESGEALSNLAAATDQAMAEQGFPPERRHYRPHITLARCRTLPGAPPIPQPCQNEQTFPELPVDSFALMQTLPPEARRNGSKSRYNIVHLFPFGTPHSFAG